MKEAGLFKHWPVLMVAMNLCHGPFADDLRYQQLQESLAELFANKSYQDVPLFVERGKRICEELGGAANEAPAGEKLKAGWEACSSLGLLTKKGYRVNLNRCMGVHRKGEDRAFAMVVVFYRDGVLGARARHGGR